MSKFKLGLYKHLHDVFVLHAGLMLIFPRTIIELTNEQIW